MPIYNITSLCNMAKRCGTNIPSEIINQFSDDVQKNEEASIKICIKQIEDLQSMGINSFHFYALNQSELLQKILSQIKIVNFLTCNRVYILCFKNTKSNEISNFSTF